MIYRKISDDEYVVHMQDRYFLTNGYTLELILAYKRTSTIQELAAYLDLPEEETSEIYNSLNQMIENIAYNETIEDFGAPLHAQWKITNRCNLRCKHCYIGEKNDRQLINSQNVQIAERLVSSNILEVTISGGEPLIVEELPEIIHIFNSNGIFVHIFTNGLFIPELINKLGEKIRKENIRFTVSLDGMETSHEIMRGKGTFKPTINGIRSALEKGYNVYTNTVINEINYNEIDQLIFFCRELGVEVTQLSSLIEIGWAKDNKDLLHLQKRNHNELLDKLFIMTKKIGTNFKLLYSPMPYDNPQSKPDVYEISDGNVKKIGTDSWQCGAGKGKCVIDEKGDVLCCPFIPISKMGNILENHLTDLWKNKKREEFIHYLRGINGQNRVCAVIKGSTCTNV